MRFALLSSLPIALILAACGSAAGSNASSEQPAGVLPHCRSGTATVGSRRVAVAAVARRPLRAYRRPGRHPFARFGRRNQNGYETIFRVLTEINSQGTPILLVEQNALMALDVAKRGYVMETGTVVLADEAKALRENEQVRKTYLGEE